MAYFHRDGKTQLREAFGDRTDEIVEAVKSITDNEDEAADLLTVAFLERDAVMRSENSEPYLAVIHANAKRRQYRTAVRALTAAVGNARERQHREREQAEASEASNASEDSEAAWRLHRSLESLPNKARTALYARFVQGNTLEEIAVHMGMSVSTIWGMIDRARNQLRATLAAPHAYNLGRPAKA